MKITYLGHSAFQIDFGGKKLLVDPFISGNELADQINIDEIEADYILITHGHQDHILDVEAIAKNTGASLISNFEIISHYSDKGIEGHGMNHGGKYDFDFGTVKYVNAIHSSSFPDGSYAGNPGGFVIWNQEDCLYHAGDTALTEDMKLIARSCPPLKAAILPIGDNFTMGYEDASIASDFIECNQVIGCHYDTFPPIKIDREKAKGFFTDQGKSLLLPSIGESREF